MLHPQLAQCLVIAYLLGMAALVPLGRPLERLLRQFLGGFQPNYLVFVLLTLACCGGFLWRSQRRNLTHFSFSTPLGAPFFAFAVLLICSIPKDAAEFAHFVVYAPLAALFTATRTPPLRSSTVLSLIFGVSLLDEGLQAVYPLRVFDPWDLLINQAGAIVGLCLLNAFTLDRNLKTSALTTRND